MTNKAQLTEQQQLQEELLDEIGDFTKAITKKIGQGVGAVQGAGQKIKGVTKRSVDALGKSFQQGKQQTQKAVAGQDYKAPQPKAQAQGQAQGQAQSQAQAQGQTKTKPTGVMGNLAKNIGNVALDTAAGTGYDYRQGVNPNPTKQVPVGKQDTQAQTQAQTQTQATKRTKTGGKVAGQTSDTKSAQYQRDRRAAKKGGGSAMKQGIDQAQIDGANQGIANMQKQAGKTATKVPGQKAPVAQVDKNKDGKDDKTGKPISKTAQNVGKNTGVNTAKIGGQKVDLNDPKLANMRAAIDKALGKGTTASIDKLDPPGKEKLKKALA